MVRVLRPGGRPAVAVWDRLENTPGYLAVTEFLQRLFGTEAADALRAPYVLGEGPRIDNANGDSPALTSGREFAHTDLALPQLDSRAVGGHVDDLEVGDEGGYQDFVAVGILGGRQRAEEVGRQVAETEARLDGHRAGHGR